MKNEERENEERENEERENEERENEERKNSDWKALPQPPALASEILLEFTPYPSIDSDQGYRNHPPPSIRSNPIQSRESARKMSKLIGSLVQKSNSRSETKKKWTSPSPLLTHPPPSLVEKEEIHSLNRTQFCFAVSPVLYSFLAPRCAQRPNYARFSTNQSINRIQSRKCAVQEWYSLAFVFCMGVLLCPERSAIFHPWKKGEKREKKVDVGLYQSKALNEMDGRSMSRDGGKIQIANAKPNQGNADATYEEKRIMAFSMRRYQLLEIITNGDTRKLADVSFCRDMEGTADGHQTE
ncbi:hypothetical protein VTL71DRAFT_9296 [Oculimacula yallundae]|uniref:Uncharacterized protein n=1 Tax=Oculimacula yallundae TaxID=86028 RepID=A0ABR4BSN4_9HELO